MVRLQRTISRPKSDEGIEQLKSELKALQLRLQTAEQTNKTLHLLLEPAEKLRSELHIERRNRVSFYEECKMLEAMQRQLVDQVNSLEVSELEERDAARLWHTRTSELEYACASLAVREDTANGELQQAHCRERLSAVTAVENSIAYRETENAEMMAKSEARTQCSQVGMLQRQLATSGDHVQELQRHLRDVRTESTSVQASFKRLLQEHELLRKDQEAQYLSLCKAVSKSAALLSRNERLEDELAAARKSAAPPATQSVASARITAVPVDRGFPDAAEPLLGSSLSEACQDSVFITQAAVRSPPSSRQHLLDGLASPLGGQLSPLRSPTSRHDYPGRRGRRNGSHASRCVDDTVHTTRQLPGLSF